MAAHTENVNDGHVGDAIVPLFQANSCLVAQLMNGTAVMTLTADCDIPILAGDCSITVNSFTEGKWEIASACEATLMKSMKCCVKKSKAEFHKASLPIFDGVKSPRLRASMMVIVGCDVHGPDMTGVKVPKLAKLIETSHAPNEEPFASKSLCQIWTQQ